MSRALALASLLVLLLGWFCGASDVWGQTPAPCTRWASSTVAPETGSGTQANPYTVRDFLNTHAAQGEVLCLKDGTYTGQNGMLEIPPGLSGVAGNPITIRAENDGEVFINGEYK